MITHLTQEVNLFKILEKTYPNHIKENFEHIRKTLIDDQKILGFERWLHIFDDLFLQKKKKIYKPYKLFQKKVFYLISLFYNRLRYDYLRPHKMWWDLIEKNIFLGALPLHKHLQDFKNLDIENVLSLVENFERDESFIAHPLKDDDYLDANIKNFHLEHEDFIPVNISTLYKAACIINDSVNNNQNIYVHCKAGKGRSAGSVATYLMLFKKLNFEEAHKHIHKYRPRIDLRNKKNNIIILSKLFEYFNNEKRDKNKILNEINLLLRKIIKL